jgi:signal transduction histidine kinase
MRCSSMESRGTRQVGSTGESGAGRGIAAPTAPCPPAEVDARDRDAEPRDRDPDTCNEQSGTSPGQSGSRSRRGTHATGTPVAAFDELLSILSHELRSPLTTIKGSSRTLLRHGARLDADTTRQLLEDIDGEADRLNRLIDNLLDLSRAGAGKGALRTEPTAVDVLIRRVVAEASPRAGHRRLRVRLAPDLPQPPIDPVRIEQVLRNLLDNAIKFSPPAGTIDVSAGVQAEGDRAELGIAVADQGPGIAPEYHEKIFERFFRVEPEGRSVGGVGLGLAICRHFVELHGGRIGVSSTVGRGATFRFTLPIEPMGAAPATSRADL